MAQMLVAVFTTFASSRKEPLGDTVERVHAAFGAAGFGEPKVHFVLSDPAGSVEANIVQEIAGIKRVSSIGRVLKRWPQLERFARVVGSSTARGGKSLVMSNLAETGAVEPVDFAILKEIARGVPKSFAFHGITLHFSAPGFSQGPYLPASADPRTVSQLMHAGVDIGAGHPSSAGISVKDSWWVNGRQRFMAALRVVEADPSAKKLPAPPANVASLFAACGKVRKTLQVPMVITEPATEPGGDEPRGIVATETGEAIQAVVRAYRAKMPELLVALPHDLPEQVEAPPPRTISGLLASGPKKPDLVRAFAPLGYDCRGESGSFTLKRRTAGNLAVELKLDVGTWSNSIAAFMRVVGLVDGQGFKATLLLPVSHRPSHGQFPIGGPERWRQIVDNLGALVAALDHSFVPEIEAISGPSPEWFRPGSS
jgi:hypothetical protein